MSRWEPDGRRRLEEAALALYAERGFESTTAAEIANRAGLTARTFFRHFGDKREVLFGNERALQDLLVATVTNAPEELAPIDAIAAGLHAGGEQLQPRRQILRQRAAIIATNAELQERELIKLASLSAALADALQHRGVPDADATLAAEVSIAVFRVAFERWIDDANQREFSDLVSEALDQLATFAAARMTVPLARPAERDRPSATGRQG
jgi:AcrR family transcriptional regulator